MRFAFVLILVTVMSHAAVPGAFLQSYCIDCHGAQKQKGDRRFDHLELPATTADDVIDLQDIIDQLNLGDMPPKKAKQPAQSERKQLIATFTQAVAEAHTKLRGTTGQTVLRRLNRREYIQTVGDLLSLDMRMFDPTTKFPRDQMADHMDNLGEVLQTSGYLLAQYLDAADQVIEKAFAATEQPKEQTWTFNDHFVPQDEHLYPHGSVYHNRYLCVYEVTDSEKHEGGYVPISDFREGVPSDGFYEIKVKAQAMNRVNPYDPSIFNRVTEEPFRLGIVPGDVKAGPLNHPQPLEPELAEVVIKDGEPEFYTMTVWLDAGHTPRFTFPNGMASSRSAFQTIANRYTSSWPKNEQHRQGIFEARRVVLQYGQMPHIRIHEVQIRGPIIKQWPPAGQSIVLGDQPFKAERTRDILQSFASRAYRRPARADEVDHLMSIVAARTKAGHTPFEAFKDALKAVLCSPAFLYLSEPDDKDSTLEAHALASRLSYFLWSTMPDDELRAKADSGDLLKTDVLLAQTHRLLASPRANTFVEGFLNSWLNLRSLGDMPPDRDAFERYYTLSLQSAMKQETQLFMRHLIDANESITRFLDADYTFVNQPLATLYGLGKISPPEHAHEFQKVSLTNHQRGGLLGQGSVLTVSANGIETSPVIRGLWLLENILGTPPPPPPDNVPPIDPDVRGAKTMRDIISKHRDNPACFECHQKIDPLGFALENFDPIGAWRTDYSTTSGKNRKRSTVGPAINPSGELPGGQKFKDIAELKKILVTRKSQFAKMLTDKLLSYACGRRTGGLDRPALDHIQSELAKGDDGLRHLIELIVTSEMFRSK